MAHLLFFNLHQLYGLHLESIVYNRFANQVYKKISQKILVVSPSYELLQQWLKDYRCRTSVTTFVMPNSIVQDCLLLDQAYCYGVNSNLRVIDTIDSNDINYDTALIFTRNMSDTKIVELLSSIKRILSEDCDISILTSDLTWSQECFQSDLGESGFACKRIITLPTGLVSSHGSGPRKKLLVDITKATDAPVIEINSFDLLPAKRKTDVFVKLGQPIKLLASRLDYRGQSVRGLLAKERSGDRPRERQLPYAYEFTAEITIYYTIDYLSKEQIYRASAYICEPASEEQRKRNFLSRGKKIKESTVTIRGTIKNELIEKVETQVPFKNNFRMFVSKHIKDNFHAGKYSDLTIKTFWYVFGPYIASKFNSYSPLMANDMFSTSHAFDKCLLRSSKLPDYERCMDEFFTDLKASPSEKKRYFKQMYYILEAAAAANYLSDGNPLKDFVSNGSHKSKISEVRRALGKKSLSDLQEERLVSFIWSKINAGKWAYAGVWLRFVSGIHPWEISALTWNDIKRHTYLEYEHLLIEKRCGKAGEIVTLNTKEQYRVIPLTPITTNLLQQRYDSLSEKFPVDDISSWPIFPSKRSPKKHCDPRELKDISKIALTQGAGLPSANRIDSSNDTFFSDATVRDIFRSHFIYQSRSICLLDNSNLCYLLGIKPDDVISLNYIGFANRYVVRSMAIQLSRWIENLPQFISTRGADMEDEKIAQDQKFTVTSKTKKSIITKSKSDSCGFMFITLQPEVGESLPNIDITLDTLHTLEIETTIAQIDNSSN